MPHASTNPEPEYSDAYSLSTSPRRERSADGAMLCGMLRDEDSRHEAQADRRTSVPTLDPDDGRLGHAVDDRADDDAESLAPTPASPNRLSTSLSATQEDGHTDQHPRRTAHARRARPRPRPTRSKEIAERSAAPAPEAGQRLPTRRARHVDPAGEQAGEQAGTTRRAVPGRTPQARVASPEHSRRWPSRSPAPRHRLDLQHEPVHRDDAHA